MTTRTQPEIAVQCSPPAAPLAPLSVDRVRTGVVIIGTAETVAGLCADILAECPDVIPTGAVLVQRSGAVLTEPKELAGGVPVLGTIDDLTGLHARYRFKLAIVAVPTTLSEARTRTVDLLRVLGIPTRLTTPVSDILVRREPEPVAASRTDSPSTLGVAGHTWRASPTIDLGELIGRSPRTLDREAIARVVAGKRVLITGAGGSIGSHLAGVIAGFAPSGLVLMERAENSLFEIDRVMAKRFPTVPRRALLHDVVDARATARTLRELKPDIVLHAAAHKHVPLMEDHPAHAVANNLMGTRSIADAALGCGAERFVMISSDKAVNPTSIMGATKRLAEIYVRHLGEAQEHMQTSMVRFGNVLGSACSVLTIWSSQIAEGGPITVTDPRMTRYFMTIPEAATLVVASMTLPERASGSVYVLDMGEPIRILDLARRFVLAHGLSPRLVYPAAPAGTFQVPLDLASEPSAAQGAVMDIEFSGARPGEKLHEELAYAAENLEPTAHPGICAWSGIASATAGHSDAHQHSQTTIAAMLTELQSACESNDPERVIAAIRKYVPEMQRANAVRRAA